MNILLKYFVFLSIVIFFPKISFSQIIYPGEVSLIGDEEDFWVWGTDSCSYKNIPDGGLRPYRDNNDSIHLIIHHYDNYKLKGTTFDNLVSDCNPILSSAFETDPSKHNSEHWILAPYTDDGINIHALVHNENTARSSDTESGGYYSTSIVYYSSSDKGKTWSKPTDNVVYSESDNTVEEVFLDVGHLGVEIKSNILKHNSYYYALIESTHIEINNGRSAQSLTYIIRTDDLSDPNGWRGWDGSGYNVIL